MLKRELNVLSSPDAGPLSFFVIHSNRPVNRIPLWLNWSIVMAYQRIIAKHDPFYKEDSDPVCLPLVTVQWGPYGSDDDTSAQVGVMSAHSQDENEPDGKMVWLNRKQLNELIRTLRRARRASYGEDE